MKKILLTLTIALFCCRWSTAEDWPVFRGPNHDGKSSDTNVPQIWSADQHVKWKAPLPQMANGSPIVIAGKVLVTSAEDKAGRQRTLYCFDAVTGDKQWAKTVALDREMPTHKTNPYCGTTPASDGQRVVVWHATAGLYCYDLNGNFQWSRDLGEFEHMWGYGSSPVIYQGKVILHSGPSKEKVFIAALNLADGETLWEHDEPFAGNGERNPDNQYMGSWSTPIIAHVGGQDQLITMMLTRVISLDPASGKLLWWCNGLNHEKGDLSYSAPTIVGDVCFVTGGFKGPAMGIRLGGRGDVTATHQLWRTVRNPQSIGSGVAVDGYVYRPNAGPNTIQCLDPKTGQAKWTEREGGGSFWGSMVAADGLLYATDQEGTTVVFKPNPERLELVAQNKLGEATNATPAIANGRIYIRTEKHLFCIGG